MLLKSYNGKVCATSGEFIEQEFVVLLSILSPSMTYCYAVSVTQKSAS